MERRVPLVPLAALLGARRVRRLTTEGELGRRLRVLEAVLDVVDTERKGPGRCGPGHEGPVRQRGDVREPAVVVPLLPVSMG